MTDASISYYKDDKMEPIRLGLEKVMPIHAITSLLNLVSSQYCVSRGIKKKQEEEVEDKKMEKYEFFSLCRAICGLFSPELRGGK